MWFFRRRNDETGNRSSRRRVIKRIIVGFIIGSAISSIVGNKLLKEKRKQHLGEDASE